MATQTPERDELYDEDTGDTKPAFNRDRLSGVKDENQLTKNDTSSANDGMNALPGNKSSGGGVNFNRGGRPRTSGTGSSGATSRGDLNDQEKAPASGASSSTAGEGALINRDGGIGNYGFKNEKTNNSTGRFRSRIRLTKKKSIALAVTGAIAGGGIFGLSIMTGPMQLMHLSQILQKNNFGNEKASSMRLQGLWRYHKTGDIGETRVSYLGSRTFGKVTDKLKDIGVEFERNKFTGHPEKLTIDPDKHPATRGLSPARQAAALDKLYGVDSGTFSRGGGRFTVDIDPTNAKGIKVAGSLVETSLQSLEDGRIVTAQNERILKKYFHLPKLFSPISKRVNAAENRAGQAAAKREEKKKAEEERRKQLRDPVVKEAASARAKIKENLGGNKAKLGAGAVLFTTQGLCIVRSVASSAVTVNRAEVALPATIEAVDKQSVGSQSQSNINADMDAFGAVSDSLKDKNGTSVFGAKALQATSGKSNPSGEDLSDDYKQAFSNESTAKNIQDSIGSFEIAGKDVSGLACSTPGLVVQGGLSIGLALVAVGGTPFTGGASLAAFTAKQGTQAAASFGVMYLLQKQFEKLITDDTVLPASLSGAEGGNLLAYGGREAANITARSMGGVELSASDSAAIDNEEKLASQEEFRSQNFASRIFNVYDQRSVASGVVASISSSPSKNFSSLIGSFSNIGKLFSSVLSTFTPKASAAEPNYNWGNFKRSGFPKAVLNDPEIQNPYDNGEKVAAILESGEGGYADRIKKCFGSDVSKGSNGWEVVPNKDVNPAEEDYVSGNCRDISDQKWRRMMAFVLDSRTMDEVTCYDGDDEACSVGEVEGTGGEESSSSEEPVDTGDLKIKKLNPALPGAGSGGEIEPKAIILHWWSQQYGDGIDPLVRTFKSNGLSVQLGITSEGEVYQLTEKLTTKTSHAIGGNSTAFGIEIEGGPGEFGKEGIEKYPKKFDAVVKTVQYLKDKYNIPVKKSIDCGNVSGILQHLDLNSCPGADSKSDIDDYYFNEVMKRVK